MPYWPAITSFHELGRHSLGSYTAVLCGDIVVEGTVEYRFLLVVNAAGSKELRLIVSSEVNRPARGGGGSHFLCVFPGEGHENLGASDDWGDQEKFVKGALAVAAERLGMAPAGSGPIPRPGPPKPGRLIEAISPRLTSSVDLGIRERTSGGVVILGLEGDLNFSTFQALDSRLKHLLSGGTSRIVIDLGAARSVLSVGWGCFIRVSDELKTMGGGLSIARPNATHRLVIDAMGLSELFHICDTVDEAVSALGE